MATAELMAPGLAALKAATGAMTAKQQTDAEVAVLVSACQNAARRAGLDSDSYEGALAGGSLSGGELDKYQGGARNLLELAPRVGRWATVYKTWALAGQRDDGSSYDLGRWLAVAKDYSDAIELQAGVAVDRSLLAERAGDGVIAAEHAVEQAVNDLKKPLGSLWEAIPFWAKAAGAGALAVAVLGAVALAVHQVRKAVELVT